MYHIAIPLIKKFEGLMLEPYLCSARKLTIGYGEVINPNMQYGGKLGSDLIRYASTLSTQHIAETNGFLKNRYPNLITKEFAEKRLELGVRTRWRVVSNYLPKGLTDHQCAAIASFVYNLGTEAFITSRLRREIFANPNSPEVGVQFKRFIHAGGKPLKGLVLRRAEEVKVYYTEG